MSPADSMFFTAEVNEDGSWNPLQGYSIIQVSEKKFRTYISNQYFGKEIRMKVHFRPTAGQGETDPFDEWEVSAWYEGNGGFDNDEKVWDAQEFYVGLSAQNLMATTTIVDINDLQIEIIVGPVSLDLDVYSPIDMQPANEIAFSCQDQTTGDTISAVAQKIGVKDYVVTVPYRGNQTTNLTVMFLPVSATSTFPFETETEYSEFKIGSINLDETYVGEGRNNAVFEIANSTIGYGIWKIGDMTLKIVIEPPVGWPQRLDLEFVENPEDFMETMGPITEGYPDYVMKCENISNEPIKRIKAFYHGDTRNFITEFVDHEGGQDTPIFSEVKTEFLGDRTVYTGVVAIQTPGQGSLRLTISDPEAEETYTMEYPFNT